MISIRIVSCVVILRDSGWTGWYDLGRLNELREVPDSSGMIILDNTDDIVKKKEMENCKANGVYEEVIFSGNKLMSTRWVITEKQKQCKVIAKAKLVAQGFEENTDSLRKDSSICSQEWVRILISRATSKGRT